MLLQDMKKKQVELLDECDRILNAAKDNANGLTATESAQITKLTTEANNLTTQIQAIASVNTLRGIVDTHGRVIVDNPENKDKATGRRGRQKMTLSAEYVESFDNWAASRCTVVSDALRVHGDSFGGYVFPIERPAPRMNALGLFEGTNSAGGFAVQSVVAGEIIPLAPPELGVQTIAKVVPTTTDVRFPRKGAHGTAATKAESSSSSPVSFAGTDPTLEQFTLSAFMVGHVEDASWELVQDVALFQDFMQQDIALSIAVIKEGLFVSGTGSGQAQGLIGNTGAGLTAAPVDSFGNLLSIAATFDIQGLLNTVYHANASWLMRRASSIALRKAQFQANLFEPVFTRVNGQDYLHNYPVAYSDSMPAIAATATPVLFGDFKAGYIIGERGGNGVSVKILDQTKAVQGLVEVLGYQRVDGRVRRSEAIQAITLHV